MPTYTYIYVYSCTPRFHIKSRDLQRSCHKLSYTCEGAGRERLGQSKRWAMKLLKFAVNVNSQAARLYHLVKSYIYLIICKI